MKKQNTESQSLLSQLSSVVSFFAASTLFLAGVFNPAHGLAGDDDGNPKVHLQCRDFSNGISSIQGYLEPLPNRYNRLGTYFYLCSKKPASCSDLANNSSFLTQHDWVRPIYLESPMVFRCPNTRNLVRSSWIQGRESEWDHLARQGIYFPDRVLLGKERSLNCHAANNGTIWLSGFLEEAGGVVYLCKKDLGTCTDFKERANFYLSPENYHLWKRGTFDQKRAKIGCGKNVRPNPPYSIGQIKVDHSMWQEAVFAIYRQ